MHFYGHSFDHIFVSMSYRLMKYSKYSFIFKGPNWKSLCQPALLPLTVDYFPLPKELEDPNKALLSTAELVKQVTDRQ